MNQRLAYGRDWLINGCIYSTIQEGGVRDEVVIIIENELDVLSSNPGRGCLHFT